MNATSVAITSTERQNVGETKTKTEITIRLQESPTSTGNATTVEKEVTGLMVVGQRKEKINTITSTTYFWEPHSMENSKNRKTKKILNNG